MAERHYLHPCTHRFTAVSLEACHLCVQLLHHGVGSRQLLGQRVTHLDSPACLLLRLLAHSVRHLGALRGCLNLLDDGST